jgi:hypothetical protein
MGLYRRACVFNVDPVQGQEAQLAALGFFGQTGLRAGCDMQHGGGVLH